ncbi:unnamed protein product [Natator depressus]
MESRFRVGTPKKRINSSDEQVVKELFFELKRNLPSVCNPKALMLLQPLSQGERRGFVCLVAFWRGLKGRDRAHQPVNRTRAR